MRSERCVASVNYMDNMKNTRLNPTLFIPTLLCALFGGVLAPRLATAQETAVPMTVVNYAQFPVHAAAVVLEEKLLCDKLKVPPGTPLQVRSPGPGKVLPLTRTTQNGQPVICLHLSLAPGAQLDLVAERAPRWPENQLVKAKPGLLRNGVVRMALEKKGWNFGFDAERATLVEDAELEFWVDNQNRGRLLNSSPRDLGLADYAEATLEKSEAFMSPEGRPSLRLVKKMGGLAREMTVVETFELAPGMPLLICRIRWQNDSDKPLWVAYVGSGDGIHGRWSRELLPGPLIERKKSPIQGDINGGETRSAWLGQICRISMESPGTGCGLGMSTLLPTPGKVGQGSMIWGCGAAGFQCNVIDPVQGQFPFLVKPHGALDNGFAFLAAETGVSVFRQTVELWKALQAEQLPVLSPPCAVFVAGEPVQAQTVAGIQKIRARRLALRLDFNKHLECRVDGATKVVARLLASGRQPVTLLETSQPTARTLDLNQALGWPDEVAFVLETSEGATVSIAETLPVPPALLSPVADAEFTDFASMFRWCSLPMVVDYQLQWSRSADFASSVDVLVTSSQEYPWYLVPEEQWPAAGQWYYRIRGLKGDIKGAWSESRRFTVNKAHATRPVKRPLTAKAPLFTLEATRVSDFTQFHPDIPAELAPYVGIIAEGMEGKGIPVTQFARGMEKLPLVFMLRSHWVGLADIEWLFQHVPNFVGIQGGEHLSSLYRGGAKDGEMVYHHRLTRLCAKYGMFYQEADGTYKDDKWQELMDEQGPFVRQFGPWLVLSQKNNIIRRQFYSQSCALGLWLGNVTHQHGAWEDGGFYWQNAGFNGLGVCAGERKGVLETMPRIFWTLNCVMGVSRGCGIYSLDGQTLMYSAKAAARDSQGPWRAAIWSDSGETSDTFKRFVAPLIRGVVLHDLIPTKEQVLQNIKLAVYNDMKGRGNPTAWPHYVEYGPLYATTYGFRKMGNVDGQLWEFFPNTGRYYFIPVLPQGNEPFSAQVQNLPVSQLQDPANVKRIYDAAYPAWYDGDALVCHVADTLTVLNSHENEDITQSYSIPLSMPLVTKLSGTIGPHACLLGKLENRQRRFWLQANTEYPERDTQLTLTCARKPTWKIVPASAGKEAAWSEPARTLTLRLAHAEGAVEVTVE